MKLPRWLSRTGADTKPAPTQAQMIEHLYKWSQNVQSRPVEASEESVKSLRAVLESLSAEVRAAEHRVTVHVDSIRKLMAAGVPLLGTDVLESRITETIKNTLPSPKRIVHRRVKGRKK